MKMNSFKLATAAADARIIQSIDGASARSKQREVQRMEPIFINREAIIIQGKLAGFSGRVVGADSEFNEVEIEVEEGCRIVISRDKVAQGQMDLFEFVS